MSKTKFTAAKVLAINLKYYRDQIEKTQAELSEICGMSQKLYQTLEAGRANPSLDKLSKLAEAFKISLDRLVRLDRVRVHGDVDDFLQKLKKEMKPKDYGVAIRTYEGILLWGNDHTQNVMMNGVHDFGKGALALDTVYNEISRFNMRAQIDLERRGIAETYINHFLKKNGEFTTALGYPTLIYPEKGREPLFTVIFGTELGRDCNKRYYDYCNSLLKCVL